MSDPHKPLEKALDRAVFGTNDPDAIRRKVAQMGRYLEHKESSLGLSLLGLRHRDHLTLREAALKAGVPEKTWKAWEADFETPTVNELKDVLKNLEWSRQTEKFLALREKAPRVRLLRLTTMQPNMLAARGVAGVSGSYEWQALDEGLKGRLQAWAAERDMSFPDDLVSVLAGFADDEERERWMTEVLGE